MDLRSEVFKLDSVVDKIKNEIQDRYRSFNIDSYELFYMDNRTERISVVNNKLVDLSINCNKGIAYRCITDTGLGEMYIEKIDSNTVDDLFKNIKLNSKFFAKNRRLLISDNPDKSIIDLKNIKISNVKEKKKVALEIEDTCYNLDKRVVDIKNLTISSRHRYYSICNSNGVDYLGESGLETVLIQLLLNDDYNERNVIGMTWIDNFKNLNISSFIKDTVERGINLLGAKKIEIGKYNVVFNGQTSSKIWKEYVPYFYANHDTANLNKFDICIANDILNITDYANFNGSYNNFLCDSEGVIVSDVEIIKNGILKNYLHNQVTADKFGIHSTGNGIKDSYTDNNKIKARNFVIFKNNSKENNLLERLGDGILITEINNAISKMVDENGNIILVCSGHLIKNSQKISPHQHICISINFLDFLKKISDIGDDYYFRYSLSGTIICPSLLVEDVLVR